MSRKRICVCLDEKLHKKAKEMNLNLSAFLSIKLHEYINEENIAEGGIRTHVYW